MEKPFDRTFGSPSTETVNEFSQTLKKQPWERMNVIKAFETDFVSSLDLFFDLKEPQREVLNDLCDTGADRVAGLAVAEAVRRGAKIDFRTERAADDEPEASVRLEVTTSRESRARRPEIVIIIWCRCRF